MIWTPEQVGQSPEDQDDPNQIARQSAFSCVLVVKWGVNFSHFSPFNNQYAGAS